MRFSNHNDEMRFAREQSSLVRAPFQFENRSRPSENRPRTLVRERPSVVRRPREEIEAVLDPLESTADDCSSRAFNRRSGASSRAENGFQLESMLGRLVEALGEVSQPTTRPINRLSRKEDVVPVAMELVRSILSALSCAETLFPVGYLRPSSSARTKSGAGRGVRDQVDDVS